jgi:serine protease
MDHEDLASKLTDDGYDFVSDTDLCGDGDGLDSDPSDIPGGGTGFHGTHVAGIIAAATDNGIGVAGVGGATRIMPVRAMGLDGAGTLADVLQAVRYAAGMDNDSGTTPRQPADIINLSLGIYYHSKAAEDLFTQVIEERNIIVVAASGNHDTCQPNYPASYPGVLGVSAVIYDTIKAPYSNTSGTIDLAAPGGAYGSDGDNDHAILSTMADENGTAAYGYMEGTSMAAPHVSGVMALMKAVRPNLTSDEVQGWLTQSDLTDEQVSPGIHSFYGFGIINAEAAVTTAETGATPSLALVADPISLSFGTRSAPMYLKLSQVGSGAVTISDISGDEDWVVVEDYDTDDNGLGTYAARIDRSNYQLSRKGRYSAQLVITSSEGTKYVDVDVDKGNYDGGPEGDAGGQYVMLRNAQTEEIEYVTKVVNRCCGGEYNFRMKDVPAGEYYLIGGSDPDNDYNIGESTESKGFYPEYSSPQVITVKDDMDDLYFSTQYELDSSSGGFADGALR